MTRTTPRVGGGFALAVLFVVACAATALAAPGTEPDAALAAHTRAEDLLRQGEIESAAEAFATAARLAPDRPAWTEQALLLRRIVALRRILAADADAAGTERASAALHLFYLQQDLPRLAVEVDRAAHARRADAANSLRLAEALLAARENVEAANVASTYAATSPRHAVLQAIALARLRRPDEASALAKGLPALAADAPAAEAYDRARLQALLGDSDAALALLRTAFEACAPAASAALRACAQRETDFLSLAEMKAWPAVLATASKVAATCSGGTSCASCPQRGACHGTKR